MTNRTLPHAKHFLGMTVTSIDMLMRSRISLLAALVAVSIAGAQPVTAPSFDSASIKPSPNGPKLEDSEHTDITPGSISMLGVTLRSSMKWAYGVRDDQVLGPAWLATEHYDIVAKAAGPTPVPQLRLMLQALLADRFGLALHRETKERAVFVMVVGAGGPMLIPAAESGPGKLKIADGNLLFQHYTLPELADRLSVGPFGLDRPVLDRTGIAGVYDLSVHVAGSIVEMKLAAERAFAANEPQDPSPYVAAFRAAGLKLEAKKEPVEVLAIDHAEKVPKAN
jgi:uncharacterized protein (TIGR03435 family)